MIIRALKSHNGQFGEIVEGKEYDSTDSRIARAMDAFPDLFKPTVETPQKRQAETARSRAAEKR